MIKRAALNRPQLTILAVVVAVLFVGIAALAGGDHPKAASSHSGLTIERQAATTKGTPPAAVNAPSFASSDSGSAAAGDAGLGAIAASSDDTRIVQTGDLSLQVAKGSVSSAVDKLGSLASSLGGRVASSKSASYGDTPSATIVLRIPVAKFAQAVTKASGYGKVLESSSSGEDVTAQYTDLNARLHALESSRTTYLTLLAKAGTIGEVLSVQQRIDGVQQQIESLQGQIKVLADHSDLSTLTVSVSEKGAPAVAISKPRSGMSKAWHDGVHGFTSGLERIIAGTGTALLVLLCIAVLFAVLKMSLRLVRRSA